MSKHTASTRRDAIVERLAHQGEISVDALARHFATSTVTIRKDLAVLEGEGRLMRRYGGATLIPQEADSPSRPSRAKRAIARAASECIRPHGRLIIDSGSTTGALIPELSRFEGLVVMTNSLGVAGALHELERPPTLLMTGGTWDPHSASFQGQVAESVLRAYDFDQLFIGADGIDIARGTTTFNELLGLSRVMAEVAREVIVLVESDKFGRRIPNLELPWSAIDMLITDDRLDDAHCRSIEAHGIRVKRVERDIVADAAATG
ncbi:DeoR family transcriptional regulator [Kushneria phosphatilytica]|uniref:DeoR family transcriptional regulator n=1 Tax=Kushneria phosphatilytica TaxID=657387 RepID=A0A1S1NX76_9GAMM|nr:DeoR family transcriptional regulator [Kushneria phosphatilytica]OHV08878.1 XRE family transcriptional regulator [Kushneria phosphatilytica]QEL12599.1 DeoR family transcriptional regulator [Kushneria phosphatilytica]